MRLPSWVIAVIFQDLDKADDRVGGEVEEQGRAGLLKCGTTEGGDADTRPAGAQGADEARGVFVARSFTGDDEDIRRRFTCGPGEKC